MRHACCCCCNAEVLDHRGCDQDTGLCCHGTVVRRGTGFPLILTDEFSHMPVVMGFIGMTSLL